MSALDARDWLTRIDGIGKKTASVLLLFCFGLPLMPVDRHVERVSQRVGLIPAKATADDGARPVPRHARAGPDVRGARQPHPARPSRLPRAVGRRCEICPAQGALPVRRFEGDLSAVRGRAVDIRVEKCGARGQQFPPGRYECNLPRKVPVRYSLHTCRERRGSRSFDGRPITPPGRRLRAVAARADRGDPGAVSRWSSSASSSRFFLILLFSVIEFAFALNALLSVRLRDPRSGPHRRRGGHPDRRRLRDPASHRAQRRAAGGRRPAHPGPDLPRDGERRPGQPAAARWSTSRGGA